MASHRALGVAWLALGASACSFLLDFEELQGGAVASGGSGAMSGTGGASNQGGTTGGDAGSSAGGVSGGGGASDGGMAGAGGGGCDASCVDDDNDPCTVVRCVDQGNGPECIRDGVTGLAFDRELTPVVADRHLQLALVSGPDEFYLSALSTEAGKADSRIYRVAASGDEDIAEASRLSNFPAVGEPLSAAAIAVDTSVGLRIHAYVAATNLTGTGARAWHVVFNDDFSAMTPLPLPGGYLVNPNLPYQLHRPAALNLNGTVWGAWITADGRIGVDNATNPRQLELGNILTPAISLSLIGTRAHQPAAIYGTAPRGVFVEAEANAPVALNECQKTDGHYYGALSAPTSFAGVWFAAWTKSGTGFLTTESKVMVCGLTGVCGGDNQCEADEATNGQRNIALAGEHIQGDPAGVMHYLEVLPGVAPTADGGVVASAAAVLVRMDFGTDPALNRAPETALVGDPVLLQTLETGEASEYRGPDLAGAALLGRVGAVAWVEPLPNGRDRIRVRRYNLCLP